MEKLDILEELADIIDDRPAEEIKGFVKGMIFATYLKESFVQEFCDGIEEAVEESKGMSDKTYNKFYERRNNSRISQYNDKIADLTFDTYKKTFNIMSEIYDILEYNGEVTVRDFFVVSEEDFECYDMRYYGWKDISSFSITRDEDGFYHIHMPPVVRLV